MDNEGKDIQQPTIDITPEAASGTYSNMAMISHSHAEFIVDFLSMLPGMPRPLVKNRIILAPEHAKRLLMALNDNVKKYEMLFGEINLAESQSNIANAFDKMPRGEA